MSWYSADVPVDLVIKNGVCRHGRQLHVLQTQVVVEKPEVLASSNECLARLQQNDLYLRQREVCKGFCKGSLRRLRNNAHAG